MTPISNASTPAVLPDPQVQTEQLRSALENAIAGLQQSGTDPAAQLAAGLTAICAEMAAPPESYPGLTELDRALCEAFLHMDVISEAAPQPEIQQILKTLRRTILIDRRRIDPDAHRHALTLAVAIRQIWLISHRAGLLKANLQQLQVSAMLATGRYAPEKRPQLQETLDLLAQYIAAQEGYGASVRQEIEDLNAQLFS